MVLPIWMLQKLQMRVPQKLGLAIIFLLALVDITFDIVRIIYTVKGQSIVWDILEPTIAVIISCLPTYRSLLGNIRPPKRLASYVAIGRTLKAKTSCNSRDKYSLSDQVTLTALPSHVPSANTDREAASELEILRNEIEPHRALGCKSEV